MKILSILLAALLIGGCTTKTKLEQTPAYSLNMVKNEEGVLYKKGVIDTRIEHAYLVDCAENGTTRYLMEIRDGLITEGQCLNPRGDWTDTVSDGNGEILHYNLSGEQIASQKVSNGRLGPWEETPVKTLPLIAFQWTIPKDAILGMSEGENALANGAAETLDNENDDSEYGHLLITSSCSEVEPSPTCVGVAEFPCIRQATVEETATAVTNQSPDRSKQDDSLTTARAKARLALSGHRVKSDIRPMFSSSVEPQANSGSNITDDIKLAMENPDNQQKKKPEPPLLLLSDKEARLQESRARAEESLGKLISESENMSVQRPRVFRTEKVLPSRRYQAQIHETDPMSAALLKWLVVMSLAGAAVSLWILYNFNKLNKAQV